MIAGIIGFLILYLINFIGNKRKAFYIIRWLSKKCIPVANGKMGDTAGFAFYQTSDGYHFKNIY